MGNYYGVVWSYGNELEHHGIKGQRWGVRRYQNEDGTLTDAGRKRYGYTLEEINTKLTDAKKKAQALRLRSDDLNSRTGLKAVLTTNAIKNSRAKKKAVKAEKEAAEIESVYDNLKKHDDQVKEVKDTFDKIKNMPKGPEREAAANKMMAYIRDDPNGDAGNEAASRLHVELANKAYDAFGDYDFDKDKYANCKTPSVRNADKKYVEAKRELDSYMVKVNNDARDKNTGRVNYDKVDEAIKNDPKLKELKASKKASQDKFIEECLKAIGFPVTPENMETIWPFLYGS